MDARLEMRIGELYALLCLGSEFIGSKNSLNFAL